MIQISTIHETEGGREERGAMAGGSATKAGGIPKKARAWMQEAGARGQDLQIQPGPIEM